MKAIKNRNFRYFLLTLCLTTSLMIIKKSNILEVLNNSINPRILFESSKKNYVCEKAGDRLADKYKTDFSEENIKKERLSEAQQSIIDFARDSSYSNIKPYLKRCGVFIAFLVLAVIFLILWITYCSCCCCNCCLFGSAQASNSCACLWYIIAAVSYLIVIIVSIIVLSVLNSFFARINGVGCSVFYFLDHVSNGLAPSYTKHQNEWTGLNGILDRLEYTQLQKDTIEGQSSTLYDEITGKESTYSSSQCSDIYQNLKSNAQTTKELISESFDQLTTNEAIDDLKDVKNNFDDSDDDVEDNIYKAMHKHVNKWVKKICKAIFALTLIFGVIGLLLLTIHLFCDFCLIKILYIIAWNISMLLMLLSIIMAACFGIVGYLFKDAIQVGNYILSEDNLKSNDPLIFDASDDEYISKIVDVCANGDGNFSNVIDGGDVLNEKLAEWKEHQEEYIQIRDSIDCNDETKTTELKNYYTQLLDVINQSLNLTYNITELSCKFAKNDKNIILNEADEGGIKGIGLCVCSFLVGIFLILSAFAGIILVHKYKIKFSKWFNRRANNVVNESTASIGQDNMNTNMVPYPNNMMGYPNNMMNYQK